MKCTKCRRTMARMRYKDTWYWECRCGNTVGKPIEQMKKDEEQKDETGTAGEDSVDQR